MLGGNSEARSPALSEMPVTGNRAGVTQRQRPRVLQWGALGTTPLPVPALSWGPPALSLVVLQWQSRFRAYLSPAHPFTLATKCYGEETDCV